MAGAGTGGLGELPLAPGLSFNVGAGVRQGAMPRWGQVKIPHLGLGAKESLPGHYPGI